MKKSDDLSLCPVTACAVAPIRSHGAVVIRLDFLTHAMQSPAEAHVGRNYLMNPKEARKLAQQILDTCAELESGPVPGGPGPTH